MKVLCVGRNYRAHVKELGGTSEEPVWFWKPETAIIGDGDAIEVPAGIGAVHHEVELAVRIGKEARRIKATKALGYVDAFTVANDITARDMQNAAKKVGGPWDQAKGYDSFLPLGAWHNLDRDLQTLRLRLTVNDVARQDGATKEMTWSVAELVARASQWTTLRAGDVVLTGTPEGVGPVVAGDNVAAEIVGVVRVRNPVVARVEHPLA